MFGTFGIAYLEAMAMGLPVIFSNHKNQRAIVKEVIFIDVAKQRALTQALGDTYHATFAALSQGVKVTVRDHYDLTVFKRQYLARYESIAMAPVFLPTYSVRNKLMSNAKNVARKFAHIFYRRAE